MSVRTEWIRPAGPTPSLSLLVLVSALAARSTPLGVLPFLHHRPALPTAPTLGSADSEPPAAHTPHREFVPGHQARWRLEPTLIIGSAGGPEPEGFGRVAALEVDSLGQILVLDGFDRELLVFGLEGRLLRRFGRRGGGPGEFESVTAMIVASDGSLWIVDGQSARYTVVRGDAVRTARRASSLYSVPWLGGPGLHGDVFDAVVLPAPTREALLRVGPDGVVKDTFVLPLPTLPGPRRGGLSFPLPYAPRVLTAYDRRGYVWIGTTHEYRFTRVSLHGDTTLTVRRDFSPPRLSGTERDSIRRYVRELEVMRVTVRDDMIPVAGPMIHALTVDDRGYLWVARGRRAETWVFDVFDESGRCIAEVTSPFLGALVRPVVEGDNVYVSIEGDDGTPLVVRARIIRG